MFDDRFVDLIVIGLEHWYQLGRNFLNRLDVLCAHDTLYFLYAIFDFAVGFGLLIMTSMWMANLAKRVRQGKYGFVGDGVDPLSSGPAD